MYKQQDNPKEFWLPKVEDWGKIDDKAYELIFSEAKERFEELMTNSEDITTRGQRLLIGVFTVIAAFFGTSLKFQVSGMVVTIAIVAYAIGLVSLVLLLIKKTAQTRGARPSKGFPERLDDEALCKPAEQLKLVYYKLLIQYEEKINKMSTLTNFRALLYHYAMLYTFALVIATVLYVLYSIYSHP